MSSVDYAQELSVVEGRPPLRKIEDDIILPLETKPDKKYYIALAVTLTMVLIGAIGLGVSFYKGTGMWGNNNPVGWGFPIVNFVFWVGIAHSGTLISAFVQTEMENRNSKIC